MQNEEQKIDLQRFRKEKIQQGTFVKMLLFLFILIVLISILYFLFQKISQSPVQEKQTPVQEEHSIQIDTTGFR